MCGATDRLYPGRGLPQVEAAIIGADTDVCSVRAMISSCSARGEIAEVVAVTGDPDDQIAIFLRIASAPRAASPP